MLKKNKRLSFTLAEVLITLAIIGVVAAMTIPNLMQNTNSRKAISSFKKSISVLKQAAIMSQARYDVDYASLSKVNANSTCSQENLRGGEYSICGIFNETLTGKTYLGVYGTFSPIADSPYQISSSSFNPANFLMYSLADGTYVGFNPQALGCSAGPGNTITNAMLSSGNLNNCVGFVDINGLSLPNREVSCASSNPKISHGETCIVQTSPIGDVFPIIFHDNTVEPLTDAAYSVFLGLSGKNSGQISNTSSTPKYDLSTPEGRKGQDVENMETIANAFKKAYSENKLNFEKNFIQFTLYSDGQGNLTGTKTFIDSYYSQTGERMDNEREKINQIIRDAGIDFSTLKVNSTDDKWKYGYTININTQGEVEIWARNQNDSPDDYNYWYRQNVITEEERH